jgi:hypothetical protein
MTILATSRYTQGEVRWITTKSRGNKQTVYLNTVVLLSEPYTAILEREGDDIAWFAYRAYGDESRWWHLADANPQIFYPLDFIPGQSMRVPS